MTTDWMRKHVKSSLIKRYEEEMAKLRGETSSLNHVVDSIAKLKEESDQIESDSDRRAKDLEEDALMEEYFRKNK